MGTQNPEHKKQFTWPIVFCVPQSVSFKTQLTKGPFHKTGLLQNGKTKERKKGSILIVYILESFTDGYLDKLVP